MSDTCECTRRPGCGCSRCYSPDVATELISGDPWEIGFANQSMLSGSVYCGGSAISFTFTVYNGTSAPIPVYFTTDEDWPEGSVHIYDSDGQEVFPWDTVDPQGEEYTVIIDPADWIYDGEYTGEIVAGENRKAVDITAIDLEDDFIAYTSHAKLMFDINDALDSETRMFIIERVSGSSNLYWKLSIDWDSALPGGSSVTIRNEDGAVTPGTIYGPLSGATPKPMTMTIDPTGMASEETYTGTMTLTGYTDAAGTDPTNTDTLLIQISVELSAIHFALSFTDPVDRGTPFNVTVTAQDPSTGVTIEDYEGGILDIGLDCDYTPVDKPTPTSIDSTDGWTNGVYTISGLTVAGNSGSDTAQLVVRDRSTSVQGSEEIDIQSTVANFAVVFTPDQARSAAFDVCIQALDTDGTPLTTYTPSGSVAINLDSDDAGDAVLPVSTDATGWTDGRKTVSCTITGGAGSDHFEIEADDGAGRIGVCEGILDKVALTSKSGSGQRFLGTANDNSGLPWTYTQGLAVSNMLASPWLTAGYPMYFGVSINGTYQYTDYTGGYYRFTLTAGDKAGIKAAFIRLDWTSFYDPGAKVESEYTGYLKTYLKYSENGSLYGSGSALAAMAPDQSVEPVRLDQFIHIGDDWPDGRDYAFIPVDPAIIAAVSGSYLYVWIYHDLEIDIPAGANPATEGHSALAADLYIYT